MLRGDEMGGGRVMRRFTSSGRVMLRGDMLSADALLSMSEPNLQALIATRHVEVWPKVATGRHPDAERHVVHCGGGRYDVIDGVRLNDEPLTKDEAEDLATRPD